MARGETIAKSKPFLSKPGKPQIPDEVKKALKALSDRLENAEHANKTQNIRIAHLESQQSIHAKLDTIISQGETIMADLTALNAKVAELETESGEQTTLIQRLVAQGDEVIQTLAELKALLDAAGPGDQAAIDEVTTRLSALLSKAQTDRAATSAKLDELDIAEEGADPTPDA